MRTKFILTTLLLFGVFSFNSCENDEQLFIEDDQSLTEKMESLEPEDVLIGIPTDSKSIFVKTHEALIENEVKKNGYILEKVKTSAGRGGDEKTFKSGYKAAKYAGQLMDQGKCVKSWKDSSGNYHVKSISCNESK